MHFKHSLLHGLFIATVVSFADVSRAAELLVNKVGHVASQQINSILPDQLPMSHAATGHNDVKIAWLAKPTDRYQHAVLGDNLEAAQLRVKTNKGDTLSVELEPQRVFEDLQPRVVDLDGDKHDEILIVESDENYGASLSVFGIKDNLLQRITASEFLGLPYRWLNPVGVGDFDADGDLEIALVATPHIGGILKLYDYSPDGLTKIAERRGVSTHSIGSTELGLAVVVKGQRDRLILPDQHRTSLLLLEWKDDDWNTLSTVKLNAKIVSSFVASSDKSWIFSLSNGETFELVLQP